MADSLIEALANLDEQTAIRLVKQRLEAEEDPVKILEDARAGMEIVGKKFAAAEFFIPDLIYAGEILSQIAALTKHKLLSRNGKVKWIGTAIIGTVSSDIHDIGKNIVSFMLDVNGFDVHDLGVDVPPERFVAAIRQMKPQVVALSGFLTSCFQAMKETIEAIEAAGLRDKVKIMIGGGQIDEHVARFVGADGWGNDAMTAVRMAKKWVGAK